MVYGQTSSKKIKFKEKSLHQRKVYFKVWKSPYETLNDLWGQTLSYYYI